MTKKITFLIVGLLVSLMTIQAQDWTQIGADIIGENSGDMAGWNVSLSSDGSTVAIGAPANSGNGNNAGHVRIYQNQSGTWVQVGADIDGEAAGDNSGQTVSLSSDGSVVAIGAIKNDGNGNEAGHVRIYRNQSGVWTQIGSDINGEAAGDWSAHVSLNSDGSVVAIGAPDNDGNGDEAGHVRIYRNQSGTWTQVGSDINGEAAVDVSGGSVSLNSDGSVVAIGAPLNDGNGDMSGHVRIYRNQNGTWMQVGPDIDGEAANDRCGTVSLSSDGSIVAIGAIQNDGNGSNAGHVRIYQNQNGIWTQVGSDIDGDAAGDRFGSSVSLNYDGSVLATTGGSYSRVYKNQNGIWTQIGEDLDDAFSMSLSSNGAVVAIGYPGFYTKIYENNYVGINDLSANEEIIISPNPTNGIIKFEFANTSTSLSASIQSITISDITGKQIIKKTEIQQNETIDLSSFESGIYIISIQTEDEVFTSKIVKE